MPAFGLNRFACAFAVAACDAGERVSDRTISCVDRLAFGLFEFGGAKDLTNTFRFVYPFVGSDAVANSFNLADPSIGRILYPDEDTIVHNSLGVTGPGTINTGMTIEGDQISHGRVIFGVYCRSAATEEVSDIQSAQGAPAVALTIISRRGIGSAVFVNGVNTTASHIIPVVANAQGLFVSMRNASGHYAYRNGVSVGSNTNVGGPGVADPPTTFTLINEGMHNLAFAFLTRQEATAGMPSFTSESVALLYTIVQSFQTKMLRQV